MEGEKSIRFTLSIVLVIMFALGILVAPRNGAEEKLFKVGPVKITPHPPNLEEKTVLFRWNGKYNGNKFLSVWERC